MEVVAKINAEYAIDTAIGIVDMAVKFAHMDGQFATKKILEDELKRCQKLKKFIEDCSFELGTRSLLDSKEIA